MQNSLRKKICSIALTSVITLPFIGAIHSPADSGVWKRNHIGWWYEYANSSYPMNQWLSIGNKWYYFDNVGYMVENRWIGDYYLGSDGAMLANTITPDGYTVDASGKWIRSITRFPSQSSSFGKRISVGGSSGSGSSSGGSSASGSGSSYLWEYYSSLFQDSETTTHTGDSTTNADNTAESAEQAQLIAQGLSEKEARLYLLVNEYREQNGLPKLSLSVSLTKVARAHVQDSNANQPENQVDERGIRGNLHSWSYTGNWQGVTYTGDHRYASLMWSKPQELTAYTGNGYEISYYSSGIIEPERALGGWKSSSGHNDVILGSNGWEFLTTMGVGIEGNYSHIWFGADPDPAGYYHIDNYSAEYP